MCQVFGNLASVPEAKVTKLGKKYFQYRLAESQRGRDNSPTFYTVRVFNKDENPNLALGDFVRVTGKLKADFYIGRDGKPSGTLLIIAFDAMKIAKPSAIADSSKGNQPLAPKVEPKQLELVPVQATERTPEPVPEMVQEELESDWSRLYN